MILGDVLATIAIIVFSGLAAWAGGMLAALLFPERTRRSSVDFEERPWGTFFIGLGLLIPVSLLGAVLFAAAPSRPVGFVLYAAALGVAVFGTGGLSPGGSRTTRARPLTLPRWRRAAS